MKLALRYAPMWLVFLTIFSFIVLWQRDIKVNDYQEENAHPLFKENQFPLFNNKTCICHQALMTSRKWRPLFDYKIKDN